MQARSIATREAGERRAAKLGHASILAAAVLAGGCAQNLGIKDRPPSNFAVGGTATGVLGSVVIELRIDGDSELLAVTQEGAFRFATRLETGASYTVVLVDPGLPCTLRNQTGVITGADAAIELTCTGASQLAKYAYGKASNTGANDEFGYSVALSGDTLAVGAHYEASGAGRGRQPGRQHSPGKRRGLRLPPFGLQEAYLKASNTGAGDQFGWSVALSGDTLAVGARFGGSAAQGVGGNQADGSALGSGAVYVFRRSGTAWLQEAYLQASNTGAVDEFGSSVALSGDTLAVGAPDEDSAAQGVGGNQADNSATRSGAVYVFRRSGTAWLQAAYVKASNAGAHDFFGWSVALSGNTLAVGAWGEDGAAQGMGGNQADNSATRSGAVYVFH